LYAERGAGYFFRGQKVLVGAIGASGDDVRLDEQIARAVAGQKYLLAKHAAMPREPPRVDIGVMVPSAESTSVDADFPPIPPMSSTKHTTYGVSVANWPRVPGEEFNNVGALYVITENYGDEAISRDRATVHVEIGKITTFVVDTTERHPFYFTTDKVGSGGTTEAGPGIMNDVVIQSSKKDYPVVGKAKIRILVTKKIARRVNGSFYYQCTLHERMGGVVQITPASDVWTDD
jgi:plastocyanin